MLIYGSKWNRIAHIESWKRNKCICFCIQYHVPPYRFSNQKYALNKDTINVEFIDSKHLLVLRDPQCTLSTTTYNYWSKRYVVYTFNMSACRTLTCFYHILSVTIHLWLSTSIRHILRNALCQSFMWRRQLRQSHYVQCTRRFVIHSLYGNL